jgi:hypothetical protein
LLHDSYDFQPPIAPSKPQSKLEGEFLKADPIAVGKVLSENHRFVVPIYQRTYEWKTDRQLEPLFDQIEAKASERLQNNKVDFPHYMGSLLVIPEAEASFGRIQAFDIVDGQQRLTTFHICFAALRDVARSWGFNDLLAKLEGLLLHNEENPEADKRNGRYKLQPTKYDRQYFRHIVDLTRDEIKSKYPEYFHKNGNIKKKGAPNVLAAYAYFLQRAEDFLAVDESQARPRFLSLTDAIFQNFHFIVITLSKEDDPQVIFATLNTGGEPLAAMDLVRNDVFLRATRNGEDEEHLMSEYWHIFEDPFWKAEHTQGRIRKPLMDFYLAHTLAAETGNLVPLTELYAEYKKYTKRSQGQTVRQELANIVRYAPVYREIVDPVDTSALRKLSKQLAIFDLSTAYPLILLITTSDVEDEVKSELYDLIGSYIIRRALCGLTAKAYNVAFLDFVSHIRKHGVSVASFAAVTELKKDSVSAKFPTDQEFRDAIINRDQYYRLPAHRLRYIIEAFERASRDHFTAADGIRADLSIEHIMPQQWQEHWRTMPSGKVAPPLGGVPTDQGIADEMTARNQLIHTLANLSLLTPPANASAGNAAFETKKIRLRDALLRMNLDIANEEKWSEAEIKERGKKLADLAVGLWPAP